MLFRDKCHTSPKARSTRHLEHLSRRLGDGIGWVRTPFHRQLSKFERQFTNHLPLAQIIAFSAAQTLPKGGPTVTGGHAEPGPCDSSRLSVASTVAQLGCQFAADQRDSEPQRKYCQPEYEKALPFV